MTFNLNQNLLEKEKDSSLFFRRIEHALHPFMFLMNYRFKLEARLNVMLIPS